MAKRSSRKISRHPLKGGFVRRRRINKSPSQIKMRPSAPVNLEQELGVDPSRSLADLKDAIQRIAASKGEHTGQLAQDSTPLPYESIAYTDDPASRAGPFRADYPQPTIDHRSARTVGVTGDLTGVQNSTALPPKATLTDGRPDILDAATERIIRACGKLSDGAFIGIGLVFGLVIGMAIVGFTGAGIWNAWPWINQLIAQ